MEKRISRSSLYISICELIAQRAGCSRLGVGCIIVKENRIISSGYNGPLPKEHPCEYPYCDNTKPCTRSVHAEINAITFCARSGIPIHGAELYVNYTPCGNCANVIVQSGICRVYYKEDFRDTGGLLILRNNIEIVKVG